MISRYHYECRIFIIPRRSRKMSKRWLQSVTAALVEVSGDVRNNHVGMIMSWVPVYFSILDEILDSSVTLRLSRLLWWLVWLMLNKNRNWYIFFIILSSLELRMAVDIDRRSKNGCSRITWSNWCRDIVHQPKKLGNAMARGASFITQPWVLM